MSSPFDDPDARFHVLVNGEGQHSLWPDFAEIPPGWQLAFGPGSRDDCLGYVEANWTDLRPQSLIKERA